MRVAVIGAGAIGLGTAALLAKTGHAVSIWSRGLLDLAGSQRIESIGAVSGSYPVTVATACDTALTDASAVVLALPGWAHRQTIEMMAATLAAGQTVIVSSHVSFGAVLLRRLLLDRHGMGCPVVAWGTTVVTGRRTGRLACAISNIRSRVDVAVVPSAAHDAGLAMCEALFGDRFVPRRGVLAIQLSNVNPQNHLAMALCNITRIERGEDWGNYWGITPAVGRLMEALDSERLAIAAAFGVEVRTLREHFHLSFAVPMAPVADQAAALDARGDAPLGPKSLDTRYVLEDVPYGLVATEFLGAAAAVPTPLHTSGIEMLSALYGRDFRQENDLLPLLGLEDADIASLRLATS